MTRTIFTRREAIMAVTFAASLGAAATAQEAEPLKVGVYGGYFKDAFDQHIFPRFTEETGIPVESVAEPTGEAWLVQLEQAARAGVAPADVNMMSQVAMLKGIEAGLWAPLDLSAMPNTANVSDNFILREEDGDVAGVGAVAWYITLVTNTDTYPEASESWSFLWEGAGEENLGLLALVSNSFLLEVTAETFFGGTEILDDEEGILEVMDKLAEVKPNVRLWYRDEAQFEQGLKTGEIPAGQYYHDVTGLAAADGFPVRSTFPQEGGVLDSGAWAVTRASDRLDDAQTFINFMSRPDIQALMARNVGTAPTVPRDLLDLTDEEFGAVSSDIEPIIPRYDLYTEKADWLNQKWTELIVGR